MLRAAVASVLILYVLLAVASAQPASTGAGDPEVLKKGLVVIRDQRNRASDQHADAELKALILSEENDKLRARIRELEAALGERK